MRDQMKWINQVVSQAEGHGWTAQEPSFEAFQIDDSGNQIPVTDNPHLRIAKLTLEGGHDGGPATIKVLFQDKANVYRFERADLISPNRAGNRGDTHTIPKLYEWLERYAPREN